MSCFAKNVLFSVDQIKKKNEKSIDFSPCCHGFFFL